MYTKRFNPIGTIYGCPSVYVAAYQDGDTVVTKESPSGESAFYPTAPWKHRYTLEEFLALPFHKNWRTKMTQNEVELALIGQLYNNGHKEWPNCWKLRYPYSACYNRVSPDPEPRFNPNQLQDVAEYWEIGHEIMI